MCHSFRYLFDLQAKTVLHRAQGGAPARLQGIFIHHSRPPSFSQYHNSHPGGHNNRGAPDHNHRFANGSQSDRRGFLSNSETSESDLAVFTTDGVTKFVTENENASPFLLSSALQAKTVLHRAQGGAPARFQGIFIQKEASGQQT